MAKTHAEEAYVVASICAVSLPYLASSVYFFKFMLNLCGLPSLILVGVIWIFGSAFAGFSAKEVAENINCDHGGNKGFVLGVIFTLWSFLWLLETLFRKLIYTNAWAEVSCNSSSLALFIGWIAGVVIFYLLSECALNLIDRI